jgi:hydroxyethylthiazole kinase-like uncharacterized protein yjeF
MRRIVTAAQMAEIDRRAETEFGMPSLTLMENAGLKAVLHLHDAVFRGRLPDGPFVFCAGRGNNGGDALVMARHFFLLGKKDVAIILAAGEPPEKSAPSVNLAVCRALGVAVLDWRKDAAVCRDALSRARLVCDGLAGTGLKGAPDGPLKGLIDEINAGAAERIAIDVPSGVGDEFREGAPAVRADITLTFGLPKLCLYLPAARPLAGRIAVIDPGFPPPLLADDALPGELLEPLDFPALLPPLRADAHKNTRGHLGVFAGAPGTSGAAALASQAAARCRVGLVTLYTDPDAYPALAARLASVMTRPVTEQTLDREEIEKKHRALLIGPGFGLGKEKEAFFRTLLSLNLPKVIDADGLTLLGALGERAPRPAGQPLVLTPHPGECSRLIGKPVADILGAPVESALEAARRFKAMCVLKTHVTYIASPDGRFSIVDGMNPALGTGGSGDVLAGLVAGFLAQGIGAYASARLGVLFHARIGALAFREKGWFLAEDLLEYVSPALGGGTEPDAR